MERVVHRRVRSWHSEQASRQTDPPKHEAELADNVEKWQDIVGRLPLARAVFAEII